MDQGPYSWVAAAAGRPDPTLGTQTWLMQHIGYGSRTHFGTEQAAGANWADHMRWGAEPPNNGRTHGTPIVAVSRGAKIRKVKEYNNKAILADLIGDERLIDGVHKTGVNVLYGNYSAHYVPKAFFKQELQFQHVSAAPLTNGNYIYEWWQPDSQESLARTWEIFDNN